MKLQAFVNDFALQFGAPIFGHRSGRDIELAFEQTRDAIIDEDPRRSAACFEVSKHKLGVLKVPNGLTKSLARLHIFDGCIERFLDAGAGPHSDNKALLRKLAHQLVEAFALNSAKDVLSLSLIHI